ncbi:MAG: hypothetical protein JWL73_616 [Actinomycetia bacterium]|nr:hypothetical protein [Actinomycetes bacterium]
MTRPAPTITDDNRGFWEAAHDGRLVSQQCSGCGQLRHPPRPMCPYCHSIEHELVELAGTGTVYSYAILHHPQHPAFSYPVIAVLVDLDEGVRLLSNLVGVEPGDVHIDMPVRVTFDETEAGMAVPVFEPMGSST